MGEIVELKSGDGQKLNAYIAKAANPIKGGIVVVQEIFGVNSHIMDVCDRYAKCGYTAIAPALFDRIQPDVQLQYDSEGVAEGLALKNKIKDDSALLDIAAAKDYISEAGDISIVGYCWGGTLSYLAACRLTGFSKAIGYYGGGIAQVKEEEPQIPTLLHFGDQDASIPMTDVDAIMTARPETRTYIYQAGHGFNCDSRASYDAPAAKLATERSLSFIAGN